MRNIHKFNQPSSSDNRHWK